MKFEEYVKVRETMLVDASRQCEHDIAAVKAVVDAIPDVDILPGYTWKFVTKTVSKLEDAVLVAQHIIFFGLVGNQRVFFTKEYDMLGEHPIGEMKCDIIPTFLIEKATKLWDEYVHNLNFAYDEVYYDADDWEY